MGNWVAGIINRIINSILDFKSLVSRVCGPGPDCNLTRYICMLSANCLDCIQIPCLLKEKFGVSEQFGR